MVMHVFYGKFCLETGTATRESKLLDGSSKVRGNFWEIAVKISVFLTSDSC